jgi:hypothetical protein
VSRMIWRMAQFYAGRAPLDPSPNASCKFVAMQQWTQVFFRES